MGYSLRWVDLKEYDREGGPRRWCCPFCDKSITEEHRSLSVSGDLWQCFRCKRAGRFDDVGTDEKPVPAKSFYNPIPLWGWAEGPEGAQAYLENRLPGVNFRIYGDGQNVKFHPDFAGVPSVLFALRDMWGKMTGIQSRSTEGSVRRQLGTGVFSSSPAALLADPTIICEGPFDALSLEAVGYPALAALGTSLPRWIPEMCYYRRVVIATDNDAAGHDAAGRWKYQLRAVREVLRICPTWKDWNEWYLEDREFLAYSVHQQLADMANPPLVSGLHPFRDYQARALSLNWKQCRHSEVSSPVSAV
jgi:hypothetical protein